MDRKYSTPNADALLGNISHVVVGTRTFKGSAQGVDIRGRHRVGRLDLESKSLRPYLPRLAHPTVSGKLLHGMS